VKLEHRPIGRTLVYALVTLAVGMVAGATVMWLLLLS
jgi:hypothetical protein